MTLLVRPVTAADAQGLADLLNAIIARGGTTALEEPFTPERLDQLYLSGPSVLACAVAVDVDNGQLAGFQTLVRDPHLPEDWGDIATFVRINGTQKGTGTTLFAATRTSAALSQLVGINATIRADNAGGLAYYAAMGFVDHRIDAAVPLSDGARVDRIHKQYMLDTASKGATASYSASLTRA